MVSNYTPGLEKLCIATSMLSLGLDAAGVRVMIHVSMCRLLLQYVQKSGRAGRTGARSESIVLRAHSRTRNGHVEDSLGYKLDVAGMASTNHSFGRFERSAKLLFVQSRSMLMSPRAEGLRSIQCAGRGARRQPFSHLLEVNMVARMQTNSLVQ